MNFGLIGAAGYIAPKHLSAIRDTGNDLVAAVDPKDSVGILDSYFPNARFFTEIERFDRHLEKLRRQGEDQQIKYISVCSPNYLHDAHIRLALRTKAHAICEKPLVISPWNLDALAEIEEESGCQVFNVLQLRLVPSLIELRDRLHANQSSERHEIDLTYITRRGPWYFTSWKGQPEKSGGLCTNIGIHFFDLCMWMFGDCHEAAVHLREHNRVSGVLELEHARVRWYLSVDANDLPEHVTQKGGFAHRSMTLDGEEIPFTGFTDLHTTVYEEIIAGRGFGIDSARPGVELVHRVSHCEVIRDGREHSLVHPATLPLRKSA